jgi:MoaA/NifB/PqqE/SkfB family radical SAM enzyme
MLEHTRPLTKQSGGARVRSKPTRAYPVSIAGASGRSCAGNCEVIMAGKLNKLGDIIRGYTDGVRRRLTGVNPRPRYVFLEINNTCNINCVICPRDKLERRVGLMDDVLYHSLIDQLAAWKVRWIKLFLFGEPLVHPKIIPYVEYAARRGLHPLINTNAMALDEECSRGLLEAGLAGITFSVDGFTSKTYETMRRGGDLERVRANILRFLELAYEKTNPPSTVMQYTICKLNAHEADVFAGFWSERMEHVNLTKVTEYESIKELDLKSYGYRSNKRIACPDVWKKMVVLVDGTVTTCCLDINGVLGLGDANTSALVAIWRDAAWKALRTAHKSGRLDDYPLCRQCPMPLLYAENILDYTEENT